MKTFRKVKLRISDAKSNKDRLESEMVKNGSRMLEVLVESEMEKDATVGGARRELDAGNRDSKVLMTFTRWGRHIQ